MLIDKINLDLPVEAYDKDGNLKEAAPVSEEPSPEAPQAEEKPVPESDKQEEQRVPYSRFSKVRQEREDAIREAEDARRELYEVQSRREVSRETPSLSSYEEDYTRRMKQLLGDNPVSKEIIELELRNRREIEDRAEHRALEAFERRQQGEFQAIAQNENILDSRLESLSDGLGRPLTEREEAALLEIVDEFTPTGPDGKYTGEIMPFEKAWEVLELRQSKVGRPRNPAVATSGARSQGEPTGEEKRQKDSSFNALNWKSLYDKIGGR